MSAAASVMPVSSNVPGGCFCFRRLAASVLIVLSVACRTERSFEVAIDRLIEIPAPTEIVAAASELAVTERGEFVLLHAPTASIVVLDSSGRFMRRFAREGAGPGELRYPDTIVIRGDTVFVANRPNGRIEMFTVAGSHVGSIRLPPQAASGLVSYQPEGVFLASTGGAGGSLAVLLSSPTGGGIPLGTAVAGGRMPFELSRLKQEIARGAIPPEMMNMVRPVLDADTTAWLVVGAKGSVDRYDRTGRLQAEHRLGEAYLDSARQRFFAANARETNLTRIHALSPFVGVARTAAGMLWITVRTADSAATRLAVFRKTAEAPSFVTAPTASRPSAFFVDASRRRLYFLESDPPRLVYGHLPLALLP